MKRNIRAVTLAIAQFLYEQKKNVFQKLDFLLQRYASLNCQTELLHSHLQNKFYMTNAINVAGLELNPVYMSLCDEFVTINGVNSPYQDWVIKDYQYYRILGNNVTKEQKRSRDYCQNMWYVLTKCKPFQIQPTTDLGFMYMTYLYNGQIFDVCFMHNRLFSITKYTYNQTTKNPF